MGGTCRTQETEGRCAAEVGQAEQAEEAGLAGGAGATGCRAQRIGRRDERRGREALGVWTGRDATSPRWRIRQERAGEAKDLPIAWLSRAAGPADICTRALPSRANGSRAFPTPRSRLPERRKASRRG